MGGYRSCSFQEGSQALEDANNCSSVNLLEEYTYSGKRILISELRIIVCTDENNTVGHRMMCLNRMAGKLLKIHRF